MYICLCFITFVLDLNENNFIDEEDLNMILDRITCKKQLANIEKKHIIDTVSKRER